MTAGIINVLKPCGMTSHDVISFLRRVLNTKKIGHAGTLDPDAAGVLPVFVGGATRLLEYAMEDGKSYRAEITFGVKTDTGDDSGAMLEKSALPNCTAEEFAAVLKEFTGAQQQLPPMYSALKLNGQPLYKLARQGIEVERKARETLRWSARRVKFSSTGWSLSRLIRTRRWWMWSAPRALISARCWRIFAQSWAFAAQ